MEITHMKTFGIISTAALALLLGVAAPSYAQDDKDQQQQEQKDKPADKKAPEEKTAKPEEKAAPQPDKNTKQEEKNTQQEDKSKQQEQKNAQQQDRNTKPEEKSSQQQDKNNQVAGEVVGLGVLRLKLKAVERFLAESKRPQAMEIFQEAMNQCFGLVDRKSVV